MCTGYRQVTMKSNVKGAIRRKWLYIERVYGPNITEKDMKEFLQDSTVADDFDYLQNSSFRMEYLNRNHLQVVFYCGNLILEIIFAKILFKLPRQSSR